MFVFVELHRVGSLWNKALYFVYVHILLQISRAVRFGEAWKRWWDWRLCKTHRSMLIAMLQRCCAWVHIWQSENRESHSVETGPSTHCIRTDRQAPIYISPESTTHWLKHQGAFTKSNLPTNRNTRRTPRTSLWIKPTSLELRSSSYISSMRNITLKCCSPYIS